MSKSGFVLQSVGDVPVFPASVNYSFVQIDRDIRYSTLNQVVDRTGRDTSLLQKQETTSNQGRSRE